MFTEGRLSKKFLVWLVIFAAVALLIFYLFFEIAQDPKEKPDCHLAFLVKRTDMLWYRWEVDGFISVCRELGADPLILDNQMDHNRTLSNLSAAVNREVDGIALSTPDCRLGRLLVDQAFSADIPLISVDEKLTDMSGRQLAPHIGPDNLSLGTQGGYWMKRQLEARGWLHDYRRNVGFLLLGSQRDAGIEQRLRAACLLTDPLFLPSGYYKRWSEEFDKSDLTGAILKMHAMLALHPEITNWVVFVGNNAGALGVYAALCQLDLAEDSLVCGLYPTSAPTAIPRENMVLAYGDGFAMGAKAARILYRHVTEGTPIPPNTEIPMNIGEALEEEHE
ncbi:substrate-binding domain-containing protein [Sediminispirochaeta bajacaliforniensis]|uniref:substrate-binding domain-containing protein n=1 Tax=Sediminispirochaeta bajacaliforniensis TaxID=148 RepID=UPI00037B6A1D|nr:substrate-binding domain-containing protein [Sediminispirochaeta bajacaliforniensis]